MTIHIRRAIGALTAAIVVGACLTSLPANAQSEPDPNANGSSSEATVSGDGRYVAFGSNASNLVAGDSNNSFDAFVRDRAEAATEVISVSTSGTLGNGHSSGPFISSSGGIAAFESVATNLVSGDTNAVEDVFVR